MHAKTSLKSYRAFLVADRSGITHLSAYKCLIGFPAGTILRSIEIYSLMLCTRTAIDQKGRDADTGLR